MNTSEAIDTIAAVARGQIERLRDIETALRARSGDGEAFLAFAEATLSAMGRDAAALQASLKALGCRDVA